jgi:hypothetical protein
MWTPMDYIQCSLFLCTLWYTSSVLFAGCFFQLLNTPDVRLVTPCNVSLDCGLAFGLLDLLCRYTWTKNNVTG